MKRPEILISFVAFLLVFFFTDRSWLTAVGVGFVLGLTYNVLDECNERIPIDKLIILFAAIQWIFGPFLAYSGFNDHYKYHMYVEESTYMRLAVPGVLFFWYRL